jgi:S1-C subfamily serine protease
MPAVLIRLDGSSFEILNLYGLKFVASDCRIDGTADIARCKTIEDPSKAGKIVTKPTALEIASDVRPDGTPVAFSGFPVNGLIPYTARANIAGYQVVEMDPNRDQLRMLVLDKPAWPGSSGGPVYGVNGCVVGMLLQTGIGLAFARPGARLNEFVSSR